jgi:hypothetical protein
VNDLNGLFNQGYPDMTKDFGEPCFGLYYPKIFSD